MVCGMFDVIPWFDETYIVEMGRLFLSGGGRDSILLTKSGVPMLPIHYVGPVIQETAYRLLGMLGVRLSSLLGDVLLGIGFVCWSRKECRLPKTSFVLLAAAAFCVPLVMQSVFLGRPDSWALAFSMWSLSVLGRPETSPRPVWRLAVGAFLAVLAVFTWPSALMLALAYPVFSFKFTRRHRIEFGFFVLFVVLSGCLLLLPLFANLPVYLRAFAQHSSDTSPHAFSLTHVVIELLREVARAPFFMGLVFTGLMVWLHERRIGALLALSFGLSLGVLTGLYAFRIIYLVPVFLLMTLTAAVELSTRYPRLTNAMLAMALVSGIIAGPCGWLFLRYPQLPRGVDGRLEEIIGRGEKIVFSPDYATYYIGRDLGWRQLGFADPADAGNAEMVSSVLESAEFAIVREFDPYETIQKAWTPYSFFCQFVLDRARRERDLPLERQSIWARFGSRFSMLWHPPLELPGFSEVGCFDMIRVYRKNRE